MIICIFLFSFIFSYSDYMPPGFVGAPSQNSCTACHGDAGIDGELRVLGLPDNIIPGETYRIDVQILNPYPNFTNWGFQIASLLDLPGGPQGANLVQGGTLSVIDNNTVLEVLDGISYVSHNEEGLFSGQQDSVMWSISWTAPEEYYGGIAFHISGVSGNNAFGNLGDYAFAQEVVRYITYNYDGFNYSNIDYANQVKPIFNSFCINCHNEESQYNDNGLVLTDGFGRTSYENLMIGGNSGSPVVSEIPEASLLYQVIDHSIYPNDYGIYNMPYFGLQINEHYRNIIYNWISEGANPESCNNGDINNDNVTNVADIVAIVNCILSNDCDESSCGDINGDQMLDIFDIIQIVNVVLDE